MSQRLNLGAPSACSGSIPGRREWGSDEPRDLSSPKPWSACRSAIAFILVAFGCTTSLAGSDSCANQSPWANTTSIALYGGAPFPMYGFSVLIPLDSTEGQCCIFTLSGYDQMWSLPAVALSASFGWDIALARNIIVRPMLGIGDFGITGGTEAEVYPTIHFGLWVETHISQRVSFALIYEKRFDVAYRFYFPWGIGAGVRFNR